MNILSKFYAWRSGWMPEKVRRAAVIAIDIVLIAIVLDCVRHALAGNWAW